MGTRGSRGGRGRGRGAGSLSFGVDQLGFSKGDVLPTNVLQPPPDFPELYQKPLPLRNGSENEYLLVVKKEYESQMKESPFFIKQDMVKTDVERYSDKYLPLAKSEKFDYNQKLFPLELRTSRILKRTKKTQPKLGKKSKSSGDPSVLNTLNKVEERGDAEEQDENKESDEDKDNEDLEDEEQDEEMDDGTDYANNYFDNGEGYLEDSDENLDDGPVY